MTLRYFTLKEFDCKETGENEMDDRFLELLDDLRHECGFPFVVNSGYRSPLHSKEVIKENPGMHTEGKAADIKTSGGKQRYLVVESAMALGFTGIGVAKTYVHVDLRGNQLALWGYS